VATVSTQEARPERLARNQATFRAINNRLEELLEGRDDRVLREDFLCECARDSCAEHIMLTLSAYRQVRASSTTFAVFPTAEHVFSDVESVVAREDGYWIVEKEGAAGEVARAESSDGRPGGYATARRGA
jgi:hypothetical protein